MEFLLEGIMLNRLFSIISLCLVTCSAYAATVDNCTLSECYDLKVKLDARIHSLQARVPASRELVKEDATSEMYCSHESKIGDVCYMTQQDAIAYCGTRRKHLPSARETALIAQKEFGAKGIVNTCTGDSDCFYVKATNFDKSIDEFYYSFSGYSQPNFDLNHNYIWSSSFDSDHSFYGILLYGYYGSIASYNARESTNAVWCVDGPLF